MTTNFAKATYTEIYDLSTQSNEMSILKFHTPLDTKHRNLLDGFFTQFKRWMYTGAKVTLVPVATLPADPMMISYDAGEPGIDPRDLVNPILHKPYRGERLRTDLFPEYTPTNLPETDLQAALRNQANNSGMSEISNTSPEYEGTRNQMIQMYYTCLTDPSFRKAHVQRGLSEWTYPLARRVVSNSQMDAGLFIQADYGQNRVGSQYMQPSISTVGGSGAVEVPPGSMPPIVGGFPRNSGQSIVGIRLTEQTGTGVGVPINRPRMVWRTSGFERLGWMDTSGLSKAGYPVNDAQVNRDQDYLTGIGKFYTYLMLMPPAYKQEMYFRVVIKHYFKFKTFRGNGLTIDSAVRPSLYPNSWGAMITPGELTRQEETGDEYESEEINGNETGSIEGTNVTINRIAEGVA